MTTTQSLPTCRSTAKGASARLIYSPAPTAHAAPGHADARFGNKRTLLAACLDQASAGDDTSVPLLERPAMQAIAACADQREQLRRLAGLVRGVLERTAPAQRVLRSAVADPEIKALLSEYDRRRRITHATFVDLLATNGSLREGPSRDDAVDTFSSVANPDTYAFLTERRGFSPAKFERWLEDSWARLLLD
jgi:hypothetical protein